MSYFRDRTIGEGEVVSKEAAITTPLQPHQKRAVRRALKGNLLLAHSMGSGKTLTAIALADQMGKPATVLTPASLVENFRKEIAAHKKGGPPIEVLSLPTAASRGYQIPEGNTLIIDEAHALRTPGTLRTKYVAEQARRAGRILALTGTPAYNQVINWAPLVNTLSPDKPIIPETQAEFAARYLRERKVPVGLVRRLLGHRPGSVTELRPGGRLARDLGKYVDVFDVDREKPERVEKYITVPMDRSQADIYKAVEGSIPARLRYKLRRNLPPSKAEARSLNAFYSGVRQVANTPAPFSVADQEPGAKLRRAADSLIARYREDPSTRALVYSNYLDAGVRPYSRLLDQAGVPYRIFDGSLGPKEKKEIVDQYNKGKLPVILGTGSASEGLDLKGTRLIQLLEPHFNNARLEQVIGRGIRYRSHSHLPPSQRQVIVERYLSGMPERRGLLARLFKRRTAATVDQYLRSRSEEKDALERAVKASLDKRANKE